MPLIRPTLKYKRSYLEAIQEFKKEKFLYYEAWDIDHIEKNFQQFIKQLKEYSLGKGLVDDQVPHTIFWLIDKKEYIGRITIRHYINERYEKKGGHIGYDIRPSKRRQGYGEKILSLGLIFAKSLGLKEVLLTCEKENIGSIKVIEKNKGVLIKENKERVYFLISTDSESIHFDSTHS